MGQYHIALAVLGGEARPLDTILVPWLERLPMHEPDGVRLLILAKVKLDVGVLRGIAVCEGPLRLFVFDGIVVIRLCPIPWFTGLVGAVYWICLTAPRVDPLAVVPQLHALHVDELPTAVHPLQTQIPDEPLLLRRPLVILLDDEEVDERPSDGRHCQCTQDDETHGQLGHCSLFFLSFATKPFQDICVIVSSVTDKSTDHRFFFNQMIIEKKLVILTDGPGSMGADESTIRTESPYIRGSDDIDCKTRKCRCYTYEYSNARAGYERKECKDPNIEERLNGEQLKSLLDDFTRREGQNIIRNATETRASSTTGINVVMQRKKMQLIMDVD